MESDLQTLRALLQEGMAASKQGSYERRLPEKAALPKIRAALKGLRALVQSHPSADTWRELALAEEALLHYPAAVVALQKAISLCPQPDRKDLKRLALLREYAVKWENLGLTASALAELGRHLETRLPAEPCDHTNRHTREWLTAHIKQGHAKAIRALENAGGHCDCEVLANVV